jgi:hypothetical protein
MRSNVHSRQGLLSCAFVVRKNGSLQSDENMNCVRYFFIFPQGNGVVHLVMIHVVVVVCPEEYKALFNLDLVECVYIYFKTHSSNEAFLVKPSMREEVGG